MMNYSDTDDFQLYLSRIRPVYHQLFNIAHAITGNCDRAEYCMQCVFLNYWVASAATANRHSFREGLRSMLIRFSFRETVNATEVSECTWEMSASECSDPLNALFAQENPEMRRILALKYGCRLSNMRIARLLDTETKRIQTLLNRFEARARRRLPAGNRRKLDSALLHAIRADFSVPSSLAPDMNSVFRTLEADALSVSTPSRLPERIVGAVMAFVLALLCIGAFWIAAVLLQPSVIEDTPGVETVEMLDSE